MWYNNENDLTEIVCIIDSSGSMSSLQEDTIEGFNNFIEEQRDFPGRANVTLILFNSDCDVVYEGIDIKDVDPLTDKEYIPEGYTALFDAISSSIASLKKRIFNMSEEDQPSKAIFCIITDGQENSSQEVDKDTVTNLINQCKDYYNWEFAFLSADMDAIKEASSIGISSGMTGSFTPTSEGISYAYASVSSATASYRGNPVSVSGETSYIKSAMDEEDEEDE